MTALENESPHAGAPDEEIPAPQHDSSILGRLRARRDAVARNTTVDLDIATISSEDEQLVARYRLLDMDTEMEQIGKRAEKQHPKSPQRAARQALVDSLIAACEGIYFRNAAGELTPLEVAANLEPERGPITYSDQRLGEALGFTVDSARKAVIEVFGGGPRGKTGALMHAREYDEWAAGANLDVDEEASGEV